jgi:hypothetical protein
MLDHQGGQNFSPFTTVLLPFDHGSLLHFWMLPANILLDSFSEIYTWIFCTRRHYGNATIARF